MQTGEGVRLYTGHHSTVYSLAMSPDGRTMASGSDDGTVIVWDLGSNKRLGTLTGHNGPVWSLEYSGGGNLLASGGADCRCVSFDSERSGPVPNMIITLCNCAEDTT